MIHLIGAGGHGQVVLDALLEGGTELSDVTARADSACPDLQGLPVQVPSITDSLAGHSFHVAIGLAKIRECRHAEAEAEGGSALTVIHPAAAVSRFATIGAGSFVAAGAVVAPTAKVGRGVIVNHGAIIDHDCVVGDFTHIAPNAILGGGVTVGARCLIGAGAVTKPGRQIGDDVTIGGGAVVTRDVPSGQTWFGVPAGPKAS
jgi:sugar O-acyltransferase (sialic acid O-acetyltransferase NeuD family)